MVFLDVKTGKAALNPRQQHIRKAVDAGRVRFEVFRPRLPVRATEVLASSEIMNNETPTLKSDDGEKPLPSA